MTDQSLSDRVVVSEKSRGIYQIEVDVDEVLFEEGIVLKRVLLCVEL